MFWDTFGCHNCGGGLLLAREAAKHPPLHRTALYSKEISGPKNVRRATVGKPVLT